MLSLISVALWLSSAGQIPLATEAELPGGQKIELFADKLEMSESQRLTARGHAMMRAEGAVLRADELVYDSAEQKAQAKGNVTLALTVGGLYAAVADSVTVRLEDGQVSDVFVEGGRVMQKQGVTPEQLLAVSSPKEMREIGDSTIHLMGTHLQRLGKNEWSVHNLAFTPCDCDPKEPSWRVEAARAVVDLEDKHATLTFPTIYVKSIPVFWLPWIYLPLSERRTGLLVPRPSNTSLNGFALDVPVFVTLGQSYDVTLTPGYYLGDERPQKKQKVGVRGPRLLSELQYAPSARTSGILTLGLLYDLYLQRDPVDREPLAGATPIDELEARTGQRRGLRGEASLRHNQELGRGWYDRIDASVVSDGHYVGDLTTSVLTSGLEYMRTTGVVFHRGADHYAGLEVGLRQDLRWGYSLLRGRDQSTRFTPAPPSTFHELPELAFDLPWKKLAGPLHASFHGAFTRIGPLLGTTGDEGISANEGRSVADGGRIPTECLRPRLFTPAATDSSGNVALAGGAGPAYCGGTPDKTGQADGVWQPGEREARDRIDLRPMLSASFGGRSGRVTPYLAYRQDLYLGERSGAFTQRSYPMAGAVAETELSRVFKGATTTARHSIRPVAELRYIPRVFGSLPAPYDDVDLAVPETLSLQPVSRRRLLQLVPEVRQAIQIRRGDSVVELARLDLGQGFELLPLAGGSQVGETFGRLVLAPAPFSLTSSARYDSRRGRLTQAELSVGASTGRGDLLNVAYERLFVQGSERTRAGIDTLLGQPPTTLDGYPTEGAGAVSAYDRQAATDFAERVTVDAQTRFKWGLGLRYQALFLKERSVNGDEVEGRPPATALWLAQHQAGISYGPACDCWRVEVFATQTPTQERKNEATGATGFRDYRRVPDFGATLSISRFGNFGTGH